MLLFKGSAFAAVTGQTMAEIIEHCALSKID